jgi:hypothetical protein
MRKLMILLIAGALCLACQATNDGGLVEPEDSPAANPDSPVVERTSSLRDKSSDGELSNARWSKPKARPGENVKLLVDVSKATPDAGDLTIEEKGQN